MKPLTVLSNTPQEGRTMKHIILGSALVAALMCTAAHAGTLTKDEHADRLVIVAATWAQLDRAEALCPGIKANRAQMKTFSKGMGINLDDEYEKYVTRHVVRDVTPDVEAQIKKVGTGEWCGNRLADYGPQGTLIKDLLERREGESK